MRVEGVVYDSRFLLHPILTACCTSARCEVLSIRTVYTVYITPVAVTVAVTVTVSQSSQLRNVARLQF